MVCANLCQQQTTCAGTTTTRVSGTVFMPNGIDPLPNTLVYVPNAPLQPLTEGVQSCQPCDALVSGSPLVSAVSDTTGHFTITNMPVGTHIPLVIQNGKWRRQFELPSVTACTDTAISQPLRMPSNQNEGDMPKIALVTGGFAALECVLLKMGISPSEFSNGSTTSNARVQFYLAAGNAGARYDAATPLEQELWGTQASMNRYDLVFLGCQGSRFARTSSARQTLLNYANTGGQVLVNHGELEWLYNVQPFSSTAYWHTAQPSNFGTGTNIANVDTSFPKGQQLAQWLALSAPAGVPGQVPLNLLYAEFDGVPASSRIWVTAPDSLHPNPVPLQYTFETPVGVPPAQQCGRVMFNAFHTMEHFPSGTQFPAECSSAPLRLDERLMAFMLFNLGSCR